jgi:2-polyprenyl-6-hydroxyphenyl methylase/3-demethylubiquinone-9 3-methyltransferase
VLSTLNRTLRALALAKLAAEYVLRWVPAGTHDWRKFAPPEELAMRLRAAGLEPAPPIGLVLDPLSGQWRRSADCRINYLMAATKPRIAETSRSG